MKCADCNLMDVRPDSKGPIMVCYVQRRTLGPASEKNRDRTCDASTKDLTRELKAVNQTIQELREDLVRFRAQAANLTFMLKEKEVTTA